MNALQTFFGKDTYANMVDSDVLKLFPLLCVKRPENFQGGRDHPIGDFLFGEIGADNHCWLSADDRASHIFFINFKCAQHFREYLKGKFFTPPEDDVSFEEKVYTRPTREHEKNLAQLHATAFSGAWTDMKQFLENGPPVTNGEWKTLKALNKMLMAISSNYQAIANGKPLDLSGVYHETDN